MCSESAANTTDANYPPGNSARRHRLHICIGLLLLATTIIIIVVIVAPWRRRTALAGLQSKGFGAHHLLISPDDKHLITASQSMRNMPGPGFHEQVLSVWEIASKKDLHSIKMPHAIQAISLSAKGDLLAVTIGSPAVDRNFATDGRPREVRLYAFPEMKEVSKIPSDRFIKNAVLSPDGKLLAMATSPPARVQVWDTTTLTPNITIESFSYNISTMCFAPDGKTLAVSDFRNPRDDRIKLYDPRTGLLQKVINLDRILPCVDFACHPNGRKLIVDCGDVFVHDIDSGEQEEIRTKPFFNTARRMWLSNDGEWLLMTESQRNVRNSQRQPRVIIWDLKSKKAHDEWNWRSQRPHEDEPWAFDTLDIGPIAITSDKRTLVIGSGKIYLFGVE